MMTRWPCPYMESSVSEMCPALNGTATVQDSQKLTYYTTHLAIRAVLCLQDLSVEVSGMWGMTGGTRGTANSKRMSKQQAFIVALIELYKQLCNQIKKKLINKIIM